MQETPVRFLGQEDPWRRDRLPTPVFLGFPDGSAGKESACNVRDLGLIPGLEDPLEKETATHCSVSSLENSMDYPWGCKESDMTEQLSLSLWVVRLWVIFIFFFQLFNIFQNAHMNFQSFFFLPFCFLCDMSITFPNLTSSFHLM